MFVRDMLASEMGAIAVSALLGFGLAALFRRACTGSGCVVVKGPDPREIEQRVYKVPATDHEDCYQYRTYPAPCT